MLGMTTYDFASLGTFDLLNFIINDFFNPTYIGDSTGYDGPESHVAPAAPQVAVV
jgi:hypothetical protein